MTLRMNRLFIGALVFVVAACTATSDSEQSADVQQSPNDSVEALADEGSAEDVATAPVSKKTALALGQLGLFREARGIFAPAGALAIVQGGLESPMFTCEESEEDGKRVVTCDYSGATALDITGELLNGIRTETYDGNGRFLSWKWSVGPQYSCNYGETITCMFTTKEGEICTDTFDYEGAFVKTSCEKEPIAITSCSEDETGGVLCDSSLMDLSCFDRFDSELQLVEAGCSGLFNSSSACTAMDSLITCDVDWLGNDCEVEFDPLFNLESRVCGAKAPTCSWGNPSSCDPAGANAGELSGECVCSWRANALATLCTDAFGLGDAIDEPDTTGFVSLVLRDDRPIDGDMVGLAIDAANSQFYVKVTGSGFGAPESVGPFWYGPFSLDDPDCN